VREVAGSTLAVGLPDGDVEAAVADASSELLKRRASPSSARIAVAVTAPTP